MENTDITNPLNTVEGRFGTISYKYGRCNNCTNGADHQTRCLRTWRKRFAKPPKLNVTQRTIIEDAITAISEHPETANMSVWMEHRHDSLDVPEEENGYCGTTACLAGHLVIAAGLPPLEYIRRAHLNAPPAKRARRLHLPTGHVSALAQKILGTSKDNTSRIFMADNWPSKFAKQYDDARNQKGRAKAMVARLKHYLATGE
jgi:hypothetical protein